MREVLQNGPQKKRAQSESVVFSLPPTFSHSVVVVARVRVPRDAHTPRARGRVFLVKRQSARQARALVLRASAVRVGLPPRPRSPPAPSVLGTAFRVGSACHCTAVSGGSALAGGSTMARDARRSDVETTRRGIYSRRLPGGPVENDGEVGFKTRSLKTRNLRRAAADKKDLPRIPRRKMQMVRGGCVVRFANVRFRCRSSQKTDPSIEKKRIPVFSHSISIRQD